MTFELDHLFVLVADGAPEAEDLVRLGVVEGEPNAHPGQGTANRRFFFRRGMLELLYVRDEREAREGPDPRLRLWERWERRGAEASPFGVCVRTARAVKAELPFPSWRYRPPFLHRQRFDVAASSERIEEPLVFHIPFGARLDRHLAERAQPTAHPAGMGEITGVRIGLPAGGPPSASLRGLEAAGLVELDPGSGHVLEVRFDEGAAGREADLRPRLPLVLRW